MNHPIFREDAKLSFKDVNASNHLPRILKHVKALGMLADTHVLVLVSCKGVSRKGEIVFFKSTPKQLVTLEASTRGDYYKVLVRSGHPLLIRPDNGVFDTVTVVIFAGTLH